MKKFLFRFFLFSLPFILLLIFFEITYKDTGGDSVRVSLIPFEENYRNIFKNDTLENKVVNISELNLYKENSFDILSIGDSFSNQGNIGFQNYLVHQSNFSFVHFDAWNYEINNYNPIQFVNDIINGNLLDNLKVEYIFLEIVERETVKYFNELNKNSSITIHDLEKLKTIRKQKRPKEFGYLNQARLFYKNNLLYKFNDRAFTSDIHVVKLSKRMFSVENNKLLFFHRDIQNLNKGGVKALNNINNELNALHNKLNSKQISLIFMICPDKYNVYSDFILNNKYPKSVLFENFKSLKKEYLYIDAKEVLKNQIKKNEKDLYFADDTHWSPKASKVISKAIYKKINTNF